MRTNHLSKTIIFHLILCLLLLSACNIKKNIPTPQSESTKIPEVEISPTPIIKKVKVEGFQRISASNIHKLDIISNLGAGQLYHAAISPDGKTLAALTASGIYLLDRETFKEVDYFERYNRSGRAITFTPDGKSLLFSDGQIIYSLSINTAEIKYWFPGAIPNWDIESIEFTPDDENMILVSSGLYYPCEGTGINYALYSPDGFLLFDRYFCKQLARSFYRSVGTDKTAFVFINIMSVGVPYELYVIDNKTGTVLAASYKRGGYFDAEGNVEETTLGNRAYLPSMNTINQWDRENSAETQLINLERCDLPLHLSYKYETILIDGDISTIFSEFYNKMIAINQTTCEIKHSIQFIKNDEIEFNVNDSLINTSNDYSSSVWNPITGENNFITSTDLFRYPEIISEFNHSGNFLVTSVQGASNTDNETINPRNGIQVWNAFTGKLINELPFPDERIYSIQATPSDEIMFIQTSEGNTLRNILTGEQIQTLPDGIYLSDNFHNGIWIFRKISDYQYKPDFYNHETGELLRELTLIQGKNLEVSLSEDGTYFNFKYIHLSSPDWMAYRKQDILGDYTLWQKIDKGRTDTSSSHFSNPFIRWINDNKSKENILLYQNGTFYVSDISQTSAHNIILTKDNTFWDTETGEYLGQMRFMFEIKDAKFSPNGYFLAITGTDGIVRILGVRDE